MKKRILALISALILMLSILPHAAAAPSLDSSARYLGGVFDGLRAPSENFCACRMGELWGFASAADGSVVIQPAYAAAGDFHQGYAPVCAADGRWSYIDRFGVVKSGRWYGAADMSEGYAAVKDADGRWGYLDHDLELVIDCEYTEARPFSGGLAAVKDESGWFFIDIHGHPLTDRRYSEVSDFSGELAVVKDGGFGVIDSTGVLVVDCLWQSAHAGEGVVTLKGNGACAMVGADETVTYNTGYTDVGVFSDGLAPVCVKDRWGFMDHTGALVIPALYDEVGGFSDGLAYALRGGVPGVVNADGWFCSLPGATQVGGYTGYALPLRFGTSWALFRSDLTYAATGLEEVGGGCGDRFAVRTSEGWRLLSTAGAAVADPRTPGASGWATAELREAGLMGMLDPLSDLPSWSADVTRRQFCALCVQFYSLIFGSLPAADGVKFDDTDDPAVLKAAALGIVTGDGNGRFRPLDPLTREEAATVLVRLCRLIGFTPEQLVDGQPADMDAVSVWAKDAVGELYRAEVIRGNERGEFLPSGRLSAEAAALTLYRLLHAPGEIA